jgi:HPt (histidine-containing phosphotransfer) domain-containing protein
MNKQRVTNLSYLKELAGGEEAVIKELIELFLEQIPEFREELRDHLYHQRWEELGKLAHKAKSSVMIFGLNDLAVVLKQLQLKTQQHVEIHTYIAHVEEFERVITAAEQELREELENL